MQFSIISIALALAAAAVAAPVPEDNSTPEIVNVGDIVTAKRDPSPEENIGVGSGGGVVIGGILKRQEVDLFPGLVEVGGVHV